jgi:hypothetical protein
VVGIKQIGIVDIIREMSGVIQNLFGNTTMLTLGINAFVILAAAAIAISSFALLIPLDSVPAVSGVSIILAVSYGLSVLAWMVVMWYYSDKFESLVWLNTHLMFLVFLPATIAATAMNVTSIQNTRNLLAGKIA